MCLPVRWKRDYEVGGGEFTIGATGRCPACYKSVETGYGSSGFCKKNCTCNTRPVEKPSVVWGTFTIRGIAQRIQSTAPFSQEYVISGILLFFFCQFKWIKKKNVA